MTLIESHEIDHDTLLVNKHSHVKSNFLGASNLSTNKGCAICSCMRCFLEHNAFHFFNFLFTTLRDMSVWASEQANRMWAYPMFLESLRSPNHIVVNFVIFTKDIMWQKLLRWSWLLSWMLFNSFVDSLFFMLFILDL